MFHLGIESLEPSTAILNGQKLLLQKTEVPRSKEVFLKYLVPHQRRQFYVQEIFIFRVDHRNITRLIINGSLKK